MQFAYAKTPLIVPSLFSWIDGYDPLGTGIQPADGTAIQQLFDKSGTGVGGNKHSNVQATVGHRPIFNVNLQGGRGALNFDGSRLIDFPSSYYLFPNGATTTFIVAKRTTETGSNAYLTQYTAGGLNRHFIRFGSTAGEIVCNARNDTTNGLTKTSNTNTSCQIIRWRTTPSSRGIAVNGSAETTDANGIAASDVDRVILGSDSGFSLQLFGVFCEWIQYNRSLSVAEISLIERYLSNKWGIICP